MKEKFDWPPYVFLDKIHIPARNSPDWQAYAARAIDAALIYVAVIDTHFFRSDGCMWELNYLINTERAGRQKPVEVFAIYVDESYPQPGTRSPCRRRRRIPSGRRPMLRCALP